jgi:hypothetical protein
MYICMYVYMHMLSYSIYARTWGFRGWGIMYIHILCMHIHVYYILIYVQLYIYIQHIHIQGWHVYLYTYIYLYNCVMLCGLFPLGFAFWEFRVCFLKACVRVLCVHMCVGLWSVCVCMCVHTWVCTALYVANMWEYMYTSWYHGFFCVPLFNSAVAELRACVLSTCLCVCIHTRVCVCIHTCVHSVYMWRDVRMQMHGLVYTHTSRHASMCMHVCMCALPTAAWPAPDPSYAAGREDASFYFRGQRAQGHGACAAAGARDCRRQIWGTGCPTLWMYVCMFED